MRRWIRCGREPQWVQWRGISGPRAVARTVPDSFGRLPADENWKDVRDALPARAASIVHSVFVSTVPAELILVRGDSRYQPVTGTKLLWLRNTDRFAGSRTGSISPGGGPQLGGSRRL